MPRFNGHSITLVPYNGAQHSLFVAKTAMQLLNDAEYASVKATTSSKMVGVYGALHDAHEAYLSDLPSPVKRHPDLYPVIKAIEDKLDTAIYKSIGIDKPSEEVKKLIKHADNISKKIEAYNYMVSRGRTWEGLDDIHLSIQDLQEFEDPMPALKSFKKLKKFYKTLTQEKL
jgi:5'-deoxynucleotidase YfbR-like HD superfamily hydrolase